MGLTQTLIWSKLAGIETRKQLLCSA